MSDEMDHLLTPAQKRAKTREAKKLKTLEQMGIEPRKKTKVKRTRKPMTPEQKAAAVERLALARAKRNAGKEPNGHPACWRLTKTTRCPSRTLKKLSKSGARS